MTVTEKKIHRPSNIRFDEELITRYGGRGPRYTSYPTALQFNEQFTAADYRKHVLASNRPVRPLPLSLYVHIPFCESLCYYCACNKIVTRNADRVNRYVKDLYSEISMQAELFAHDKIVEQLHFGGGTPTYLNHDQLRDLMAHIANEFNLETTESREFSIEIDARTVTTETLDVLSGLGFNRLSIGVQDFAPNVQAAVNRVQSATNIRRLTDHARTVGFRSVSYDLIYGLPHQTVSSFARTLDEVVAIQPDRLAIYNYAHLPARFKAQRMINDADLPDSRIKLDIQRMTIDRLSAASYEYIGMDHFALSSDELVASLQDGTLQRNFQGYSTHRNCDSIGVGISAIGKIGNVYAQNARTTSEYAEILRSGELPVVRGVQLDEDDCIRARIIQDIMCQGRIKFVDIEGQFNIDFRDYFSSELAHIASLEEDGLLELGENDIRISDIGRLLLRTVAMVFDRHLEQPDLEARFSRAI